MCQFVIRALTLIVSVLPLSAALVRGADNPITGRAANLSAQAPNLMRPERSEKLPGYSLEREAAALTFVRQHHPELVDLLERLKTNNRAEYEKAIRDLFRTSERLANVRERNPQRYDLEVEHWKLKSRIQLMAAKATMGITTGQESDLREALAQQADLQLQMLELEQRQLSQRLDRVENNIDQLKTGPDDRVERQLKALLGGIDRSRAASGKGGKRTMRRSTGEAEKNNASKGG